MNKEPLVTLFVAGTPKGKPRPRFRITRTRDGRVFPSVYPDPEGHAYETAIKLAGRAAMRRAGLREPLTCPLRVRITAIFEPPPSWSLKKQGEAIDGLIPPAVKPDYDNIDKACLDGLNETIWRDDAIIVSATTNKVYGKSPGIYVEVWEWTPARLL